jgi:general secretion pathway protein G
MSRSRRPQGVNAKEAGYTLTEMLVVIGVIALIAAVLTPGLMQQMSRARYKAAQLQLETVASDIELFRGDVGRYPTKDEGLQALLKEPAGVEGWAGPYAKDARLINDPWGRPILYEPDPTGRTFHVESLGATGKAGGTGTDRAIRYPSDGS